MKMIFLVILTFMPDGTIHKEEKEMRNIIECNMLKHQRSFQIPGRFIIVCTEDYVASNEVAKETRSVLI